MLLSFNTNSLSSFLELAGIFVVFLLVLGSAYFVTRWLGANSSIQDKNKNIKVIETYRLSSNKFIQIIKIGGKFIAVAVSKDQVEFLAELDETQLDIKEQEIKPLPDFKEILTKVTSKCKSDKEKKG